MRVLFILLFLSVPVGSITKRITYDKENQFTFYVIHDPEKVKISSDIDYYWYQDRKIHNSKGTYSGELLHGVYEHQSRDFDLKENGRFYLGQKDSIWNTYNEEGELVKRINYDKGILNGAYNTFKNNQPFISGSYKKGKKKGRWINHVTKDTLYYYGDKPPQKEKRDNWIVRQWKWIFKSSKKDSLQEVQKRIPVVKDTVETKQADSLNIKKKERKAKKKAKAEYEIKTVNGRKRRYKKGG